MNGTRLGPGLRQRLYASTTDTYDDTNGLDWIAIEYALNGEPVKLTLPEKIHTARLLDQMGLSARAIASRISSDHTTVTGWKTNGWKSGRKPATPAARRPPAQCGEARMYRQHIKRGEPVDEACRAANAAADRRYRLTGSRKEAAA